MEESEVGIRGANSTLRREVYGKNFYNIAILQRGRFVWGLILRFMTAKRILRENLFEWVYMVNNGS